MAAAGCAFFQFHELCEMPLGAADFIGLFSKYYVPPAFNLFMSTVSNVHQLC